jgi:predicted acylesterase/phospholipase RssA
VTHTPLAATEADDGPRRSLVLAGGGMRTSWQAGVLKALDEAGIRFHHADGTSGGIFNLAALMSGRSPAEMCESWQRIDPRDFVAPLPLATYLRAARWPGFASGKGVAERVFPGLGVDVARIRDARGLDGTFNVVDFRRKVNVAIPHQEIADELLLAGVSLPMLLPAVPYGDGLWVDSVWIQDTNLLEGVRRGSDELWLTWCIANAAAYRNGFFRQYVHMMEIAANGSAFGEMQRIAELNDRIAAGEAPDGRTQPVRLHVIRPDIPIPLDPDYYLGRIDAATLIALGYRAAWSYLDSYDPAGVPLGPESTRMSDGGPGIGFRERLAGSATIDGVEGPLQLRLAVEIGELDRFLADPAGDHGALVGELRHPAFGPATMLRSGTFRLDGDRAVFTGGFVAGGRERTLQASRARRPGGPVEISVAADGEAATLTLCPTPRQLAAQAQSLHARNTGSLPAGARVVARFARAVLARRAPAVSPATP